MYAELLARIADLVPTLQGWASVEKAQTLAAAVIALRATCVVEIGVWGGRSLLPMALAVQMTTNDAEGFIMCPVHAIDPWEPFESSVGQEGANKQWWSDVDHEAIYQGFLEQVRELHLGRIVATQRTTSANALKVAPIDLCHVDANHGPEAMNDVKRWSPHVRRGGLLCLDDVGWEGGHVEEARQWLLANRFTQLYTLDAGVMLQRTS